MERIKAHWIAAVMVPLIGAMSHTGSADAQPAATGADLIFHNGKVITVDPDFSIAQAVAISGNRFVAVGTDADVLELAADNTEIVDLEGRAVIPGLNDAHTHMPLAALAAPELKNRYKVNLLDVPNMAAALDRIRSEVSARGDGAWIVTTMYRGASFDEPETRHALNAISPESVVYLRLTGKTFLLNEYGLGKLSLDTADLPDGAQVDKSGALTGYFYDEAADYVRRELATVYFEDVEPGAPRFEVTGGLPPMWDVWEWPAQAYYEGFRYAQRQLNAAGITGVRDMGVSPEQIKAYQRLQRDGELTVRVNMVLGLPTRFLEIEELVDWIRTLSRVPLNSFGDPQLSFGGLKLDAGNPNFQGDKVRDTILAANRYGWRLNIHHRGAEGTTELVVDALQTANRENPIVGRRFVLEHNFGLRDRDVYDFLSRTGVIVSPNPAYDFTAYAPEKFEGEVNIPWEGFERSDGAIPEQYPFAEYEEAGLVVTLGTDYPAIPYDPEHPLLGLYVAVSKQTLGGQVGDLAQRATREDALRYLTINGAYATFEEDVRGSIEVNKLADLVILSDDVLTADVDDIKDITVLRTVVNGETVYEKESR